jgi:hypothetical protein
VGGGAVKLHFDGWQALGFVILSEAKDLAARSGTNRGEVLRFAQDDKGWRAGVYDDWTVIYA